MKDFYIYESGAPFDRMVEFCDRLKNIIGSVADETLTDIPLDADARNVLKFNLQDMPVDARGKKTTEGVGLRTNNDYLGAIGTNAVFYPDRSVTGGLLFQQPGLEYSMEASLPAFIPQNTLSLRHPAFHQAANLVMNAMHIQRLRSEGLTDFPSI